MRTLRSALSFAWPLLLLSSCASPSAPTPAPDTAASAPVLRALQTGGSLLADRFAAYPRVIRLANSGSANGTLLATFDGGGGTYPVYRSTTGGSSWQLLSTITDTSAPGECCTALFELPQQLGSNPAGTLLFATAKGKDTSPRSMSIRVWRSTNGGTSWQPYSTAFSRSGGLWEPEFSVNSAGQLELYFADETQQPTYSQTIAKVVSTDGGATWGARSNVIASTNSSHRPGMPVIEKLPGGSYVMAYEWCGRYDQYECAVYLKTSANGSSWGALTDFGTRPTTPEGHYARSTPYLAWSPNPGGGGSGRLLLNSEILYNADDTSAAGSGRAILINTNGGSGTWAEVPAPIEIPAPNPANWCPNYSSAILPSADGTTFLNIATDWPDGTCKAYFATGKLTTSAPIGSTIWLRGGANSGYVSAWYDAPNAPLQARAPTVNGWEKFQVVSAGGTLIALKAVGSTTYVSSWLDEANTPLQMRSGGINAWEKFEWVDAGGGLIALKAYGNARFVSTWLDTANAPLQARAPQVNGWEKFSWGNAP